MNNLKVKIINVMHRVKRGLLSFVLLTAITLSILSLSYAATPNPGHPWTEVGDGTFVVTGPTVARTYTFPDASTSVLTTNALVTVVQGGTGTSSLTGVLIGNGTSALTATTSPNGLLVGTTASQTLTGKTINASDNIITDTAAAVGNLLKSNGSKLVNFATTTALSYIRTKTGGDIEWSAMGGSGPAGADTQLQYNSGGSSWGAGSDLTISNGVLHVDNMITLSTSTVPGATTTGTIKIFNNLKANRDMLTFRTSVTDDTSALQPNLFNNYFCLIAPGSSSTTNTNHGCLAAESANGPRNTLDAGQVGGYVRKDAFSATASALWSTVSAFTRGTAVGQNGFFYFARVHFPDGSYTNSSGVRLIYGLSDQTSGSCGSDNVTNQDMIAFNYSTALSANWRIAADDGSASAPTYVDTGVPFASATTYDMYIYAPPFPATSTIYWQIDNITNGTTTASGVATTQLPGTSVFLNMNACNDSVNAVTRTWYIASMYGEVPK